MSPTGRAGPSRRGPACYLKPILFFRLHERRAGPLSRAEKNRLIRVKNSALEVFFRSKYVALE